MSAGITSLLKSGVAGLLLLAAVACERGSNNTQTKEMAKEEKATVPQETDATKNDAPFLMDAYSYGVMIVEYSELAARNSKRKAVVSFAQKSAEWHKSLNQEIKKFARQQNVTLSEVAGDNVQTYMNELRELPADRFDARYLQVLKEIQTKMITQYETAAEGAADPELQSMLSQKLPDLHAHAQAVQDLADQINK